MSDEGPAFPIRVSDPHQEVALRRERSHSRTENSWWAAHVRIESKSLFKGATEDPDLLCLSAN